MKAKTPLRYIPSLVASLEASRVWRPVGTRSTTVQHVNFEVEGSEIHRGYTKHLVIGDLKNDTPLFLALHIPFFHHHNENYC